MRNGFMASCCLVLAACGAGGGSGAGSNAVSGIEGVYTGTTSNNKTVDVLVLEDGSFWDLYGIQLVGGLGVQGVASGSTTAANGGFSMTFTDFLAPGATPVAGSGSGSYDGTNLSGSQTENGITTTFNLKRPANTTYNYGTAASLTAIGGAWSGSLLTGETATVTIAATGAFTGTTNLGCAVSGTIVPRPSGKNVFNATLTLGAAPCALAGQTLNGVGLTYPLGNGTSQLIFEFVTPTKSAATAFFAVR